MGLSVTGVAKTLLALKRTEDRTNKALLRSMRRSAEKVKTLAQAFAPVDEGNLEDAIVVAEDRSVSTGNRAVAFVGVDPSRLGEGYQRYGRRYDILTHEGSYTLGKRSQAKQDASGLKVGSKYLERAVQELEEEIQEDYKATVRRSLS